MRRPVTSLDVIYTGWAKIRDINAVSFCLFHFKLGEQSLEDPQSFSRSDVGDVDSEDQIELEPDVWTYRQFKLTAVNDERRSILCYSLNNRQD